ncbi:T9SS type A sorting domain-containing protein [Chryseobacterium salviniae]|uniref:T9SS type A sorting domain-containing protein n=1 Tax=Chryseobacterium salviniae TaxID=3101750 RepID=A0ABU6HYB6_9FLAO|nr:T9SS type A sorting domain-containing protein [Chryseobacterium sp. T9W2-O]MEC3877813.1 T9SS type A sorting domain-containing protein [Chryseobacterium sp. T9W2-O]
MRKNLFAIGLLAAIYSVQAQNILVHIDDAATTYVSENALLYSGGGFQTRGSGIADVHGNVMVEAASTDAFRTITTGGSPKTDGGNFVLRLNDPTNFAASTYGQLYINGILSSNLTGIVSKEFRTVRHGNSNSYFQQIAMPFSGKALTSLSSEMLKTFNTSRYDNPILKHDNTNAVSVHYTNLASTTSDPTGYYMLKSKNNDLDTSTPPVSLPTIAPTLTGSVFTIHGQPYPELSAPLTLQNGGNVSFGTNGTNKNMYNEKYNSYLADSFEGTATPWSGTFGKNFYQFGNPFLTNIDLSRIGYVENGSITDGNNVSNIWGIEYDPGTIVTLSSGSTYSTGFLVQTFHPTGIPVGDIGLIIKPMQTFKMKLRDNSLQTLNFNTLRRFSGSVRAASTDYSVVAAKTNSSGTVKQLGIIGLDANGKEIARTYYVVSSSSITGHQSSIATTVQASAGKNMIGTFEEAINGGYDNNYLNYWLYINEANENNFKGKNVKLVNYYTNNVKFYKFEIKENAEPIANGAHALSSGIGFYYKTPNGNVEQAKQGDVIPVTGSEYDLYYGEPTNIVLAANETATSPKTLVIYDPAIANYFVRFDPNWKKANIEVYDMSGKLVISKKDVDTSRDFVIELDDKIKNSYIVKVVSEKGEIVNTKILK